MKANNPKSVSRSVKWAAALSAIAISLIAWTASAKDNVPYRATSSAYTISSILHTNGSQDIILGEVGVSTMSGRYTGLQQIHAEPGQYDPGTHTFQTHFTVTGTFTEANGDSWDFTSEWVVIVPLDAVGAPLPPPYAVHSTWEDVGGTGRFAGMTGHGTGEGLLYGDGTSSRIDSGIVSTVGSNRRPSAEL